MRRLLLPVGIGFGLAIACVQLPPQDLLARAIQARGGPLPAFTRDSELTVHVGLTGSSHWRIALRGPASLRLTLVTSGEDQEWATDGKEARVYLGGALVSREPLPQSELASIARWVELIHLDALADSSRFVWRELPAADLPDEFARGIGVRCVGADCGEYRLFFDEGLRLLAAEGSLEIPMVGASRAYARFGDFRRVDGREVPFDARYTSGGAPLLDERLVDFRVSRD